MMIAIEVRLLLVHLAPLPRSVNKTLTCVPLDIAREYKGIADCEAYLEVTYIAPTTYVDAPMLSCDTCEDECAH